MKGIVVVVVLLILMISLCVVDVELAGSVFFGWLVFLYRVGPKLRPDPATVIVTVAAVVLFTAGVHWLGWAWRRSSDARVWTVRCSIAVTLLMFVLFTAATAMIGIAHQVGWLASSPEPFRVQMAYGDPYGDSQRDLRELGMGLHNVVDFRDGSFPSGGTFTSDGRALHGWEIHLLPFSGYHAPKVDMALPWDHPTNAPSFRSILHLFNNASMRGAPLTDDDGFALNHYAGNSHILLANQSTRFDQITDGTSTTVLIGEVNAAFQPWGKPLNVRDPADGINRSPRGFGGQRYSGGAHFALADGSVRFVSEKVSPEVLRALATPNGREEVDLEALGGR